MGDQDLNKLRQFLSKLPSGRIPMEREKQLITLLKNCWDQLNLEGIEDLFAYKLDRIEDPHWESPFLNFDIERHGGTAMGSTRAEIQSWRIDLDNLEISCYESGYRQIIIRQAIVNVKPIAEELIPYIVNKNQQSGFNGQLKVA